jgi:hypothetical protein
VSRPRPFAAVAVAAAAALVLGGCGSIQARKENADRIIDSVDKAAAAQSARMTVSAGFRIRLDGIDGAAAAGAGGAGAGAGATDPPIGGRGRPALTQTAAADLRHGRVAFVAAQPGGATEATRIYAGTTIYARRAAQTAANKTQRPWVRLDLTGIDPDEIDNSQVELADAFRRIQQTAGFDNPLFLLRLLRGALSGSVKVAGHENVGGVPTTHFTLNLDREKALRDDDEQVQDAYESIFKTIFATGTVFPGEVWLDQQGLPRRYSMTLKSKLRRRSIADLRLTVELSDVGQPVDIPLPTKSETVKVEGLGGLAQAIAGGDG